MPDKDWDSLGPSGKAAVVALGVVQFALLVAALTDIYRRPAAEVRGRKLFWGLISFVNFAGPISYFLFGRR